MYLFDIILPDRGYEEAKNILTQEVAMDKTMKLEYLDKLGEFYKTAIRETCMMHGTEAIEQFNKVKIKTQMKSQIDRIKSLPNQQGNNQQNEEEEKANPLLESTFSRNSTAQRQRKEENKESSWSYNSISNKFKLHINNKTFAAFLIVLAMIWLWRGGYRKLKNIGLFRFILKHIFGIKNNDSVKYSSISELSDNEENTILEDLEFITQQINRNSRINHNENTKSRELPKSSSTPVLNSKYLYVERKLDDAVYMQAEKLSQSELDESRTENSKFAINLAPVNIDDDNDSQAEILNESQLNKNRYYSDDIEISSDSSEVEVISDNEFEELNSNPFQSRLDPQIKSISAKNYHNDFASFKPFSFDKDEKSTAPAKNTKISNKFRGNYHKRSKRIKTGSDEEQTKDPAEKMSLYSRDSRYGVKQLRPKSILKKPIKSIQSPELERTKRKYNK